MHVRRIVRRHEHAHLRDLFERADAAQRAVLQVVRQAMLREVPAEAVFEQTVMHELSREFDTVEAELGAPATFEGGTAAVARLAAMLEAAPAGRGL